MRFKAILSLLAFFLIIFAQAQIPVRDENIPGQQKPKKVETIHHLDFGIGIGIDYGGLIGAQVGYAPIGHLLVFGAGGYYGIGFGWQVGVKGLILPRTDKKVARPYGKVMYGCNSAIMVDGAPEFNQIYNGWTVGAGVELRFGSKKSNGIDIDFNVPIRSAEFWDDWNIIKNTPGIDVTQDPTPVGLSIGYHFEF
jgi:hypothetical protein